jgi:hypothetical protein
MLEIAAIFIPGKPVKAVRNPKYLAFLRRFPCVCCGETRQIESAHFGPHGISTKSDDALALPLCMNHHTTGKHSYHRIGPVQFALMHDLDVPALQLMFQGFWEKKAA